MTIDDFQQNIPLAPHTSFKIGGPAKYFYPAKTVDDLVSACRLTWKENIPLFILGGGTNLLVNDSGFQGLVVKVECRKVKTGELKLEAEAGASMNQLAFEAAKAGLSGFEWAVSIPGTIGGAVRGNAGAFGGEIKDCLIDAEVLFPNGEKKIFSNKECAFNYRHSIFKENGGIILKACLGFGRDDPNKIIARVEEIVQRKAADQPLIYPSSGCIFKNIKLAEGAGPLKDGTKIPKEFINKGVLPVGWLVEQLGLKGLKEGGAQISEKHGNFIVNLGEAKAGDILCLIDKVKREILAKFGSEAMLEVRLIGFPNKPDK